jgi:hypothetical protein
VLGSFYCPPRPVLSDYIDESEGNAGKHNPQQKVIRFHLILSLGALRGHGTVSLARLAVGQTRKVEHMERVIQLIRRVEIP